MEYRQRALHRRRLDLSAEHALHDVLWQELSFVYKRKDAAGKQQPRSPMNKRHTLLVILFFLTLPLASLAIAQQPETSPVPQTTGSPVATPNERPVVQAENMDKMASTVTRAAEMCETMMKKEMASAIHHGGRHWIRNPPPPRLDSFRGSRDPVDHLLEPIA
jgi:hypothetical protein